MKYIVRLFITGATIFAISYYAPTLAQVTNFTAALVAAALLGVVNLFIRPIVSFFTKPLNILTLGFFSFIVNGLMLYLVSSILQPSFRIMGWWQALVIAVLISVVTAFSKK